MAGPGGAVAPAGVQDATRHRRWSADAWLLARRGDAGTLSTGAVPASYGASQAGGVLRYAIAPRNAHAPTAYLRASTSLGMSSEIEAAAGISARPLGRVPVVLAAELRALRGADGRVHARPAVLAVSQLPPLALPLGTRGEAYLQGGYVGGAFATPFIDGQLRVDRELVRIGKAQLRAGLGIWGGAQKGASRLDVGPGVTLGLPLSRDVFARVALDWRLRAAGDAAPGSGPALTLSAGF
ncbi:MAG: hypothetical protein ABIT04_08040 [Novosphingobium sp.]